LITSGPTTAPVLSLICLDANGAEVTVSYTMPINSSQFVPLYVKRWTGTNSPSVWEMN
jgi:hypothetical protein